MKLVKILLAIVIVILAVPLVSALFLPSTYKLERTITINQSPEKVFSYIMYLKNQDNFSVWAKRDPAMKKIFKGEDGKVGFISRWESESDEVGVGEQEIKKIDLENRTLETELRFYSPMESVDRSYMQVASIDANKSKVIWGFDGKMKYPMNLMLLFLNFENMLGPDFEEGLANLKVVLEK